MSLLQGPQVRSQPTALCWKSSPISKPFHAETILSNKAKQPKNDLRCNGGLWGKCFLGRRLLFFCRCNTANGHWEKLAARLSGFYWGLVCPLRRLASKPAALPGGLGTWKYSDAAQLILKDLNNLIRKFKNTYTHILSLLKLENNILQMRVRKKYVASRELYNSLKWRVNA